MHVSMVPSEVAVLAGDWFGSVSIPTAVTIASVVTNVGSESELFVKSRSVVSEVTETVFVMDSEIWLVTEVSMEMDALAWAIKLPKPQITVPAEWLHVP